LGASARDNYTASTSSLHRHAISPLSLSQAQYGSLPETSHSFLQASISPFPPPVSAYRSTGTILNYPVPSNHASQLGLQRQPMINNAYGSWFVSSQLRICRHAENSARQDTAEDGRHPGSCHSGDRHPGVVPLSFVLSLYIQLARRSKRIRVNVNYNLSSQALSDTPPFSPQENYATSPVMDSTSSPISMPKSKRDFSSQARGFGRAIIATTSLCWCRTDSRHTSATIAVSILPAATSQRNRSSLLRCLCQLL
jgi:hypothetical protein